jgi:hypothetical protein
MNGWLCTSKIFNQQMEMPQYNREQYRRSEIQNIHVNVRQQYNTTWQRLLGSWKSSNGRENENENRPSSVLRDTLYTSVSQSAGESSLLCCYVCDCVFRTHVLMLSLLY